MLQGFFTIFSFIYFLDIRDEWSGNKRYTQRANTEVDYNFWYATYSEPTVSNRTTKA